MTFATTSLRFIVGLLRSDAGKAVVTGQLMSLSPAVAVLVGRWGTEGLAAVLEAWTGTEISDADVAAELAKKGFKVVAFDPSSLWGAKA